MECNYYPLVLERIGIVTDPYLLVSGLAMRDYIMATISSIFIMALYTSCGNHVYKAVWSPITAEDFVWVAEEKNAFDKNMVSPTLLVSSNSGVRRHLKGHTASILMCVYHCQVPFHKVHSWVAGKCCQNSEIYTKSRVTPVIYISQCFRARLQNVY